MICPCSGSDERILLLTGVSNNAGGVKHVSTTLFHAPVEERHFALIGEVLNPTKARFLISIQVGNSVRPMHLFGLQPRS